MPGGDFSDNPCGLFTREVFADDDGTYVGDFEYGDGPGGPFGWAACMANCDPLSFFACFRYFTRDYKCGCGLPYTGIHVPFAFGAGHAYTVADASGPAGLEAKPAMRVDLPGAPEVFVGWAGSQVVDPATGAWRTGTLDGSTGWNPAADELWTFSCWAKLLDTDPFAGAGKLSFAVAPEGFGTGSPTSDDLDLTTDWQFYTTSFFGGFFPSSSFYWPLIRFTQPQNVQPDFCTFFSDHIAINTWHPQGSVLIKCAHLYMAGPTPNWMATFHGHGDVA